MGIIDFFKNLVNPKVSAPKSPTVPSLPYSGLFKDSGSMSGALKSATSAVGDYAKFSTPVVPQVKATTPAPSVPSMSMFAGPGGNVALGQGVNVNNQQSRPTVPTVKPPVSTVSAPKTPVITPVTPTAPATPPTPPTPPVLASDNASETPQSPVAPEVSPEALKALELAQKAYEQSLKLSPDELTTQEDLDKLIESTRKAYIDIEDKSIPMQFITGQLASVERRATNLAEPLQNKLARLQVARQSAVEASKFALERADKVVSDAKTAAQKAREESESARRFGITTELQKRQIENAQKNADREYQLSMEKFNEDKKQFGMQYAIDQRKVALEGARVKLEQDKQANEAKAAQDQSQALDNYALVTSLLDNSKIDAITGLKGPTAFLPGTKAQTAKNQFEQIKSILSLENRQKLKGQGTITDFEAKMLSSAASSIGTNLSNDAFKSELKKIRGAFANAAGLAATVKITNPRTNESQIIESTRDGINAAISDGMRVEYQ